jgi:ferredoxin
MICRKTIRESGWFLLYCKAMDWSTRKKMGCLVLLAIFVLLVSGWIGYALFFKEAPTCFDNKQNQNERGIDCGGICQRVCPMDARTIVPVWSRAFRVSKGVYNVVAYIENQNVTAGVRKINYEFRVYDDENILAGEPITGSTFIGPNDKTAIFESPVQTGNRVPKNVFFTFTDAPDWMTTDPRYQVPQLVSADTVLGDLDTKPKLSANIVNNTLHNYRDVEVVAILYGAEGNAVNASRTYLDRIDQQSVAKVAFTWQESFTEPIARIEIIPRINPFEQK